MCEPAWQSDKPAYYFDPADLHLKTYKMYILKRMSCCSPCVNEPAWYIVILQEKVMNLRKPCAIKPA